HRSPPRPVPYTTLFRSGCTGVRRGSTIVVPTERDLRKLTPVLRAVWRRRGWSRRRVAALVVASRGLWTAGERQALARRLRGLARSEEHTSELQSRFDLV